MSNLELNQEAIVVECDFIKEFLLGKNKKYKDSALNPLQIFSKQDPVESIKARIDDKLKRVMNDDKGEDEDLSIDLIGYLIILRIALKRKAAIVKSSVSDFPSIK